MTKQPTPGLHETFAEEAAMSTDKAMVTGELAAHIHLIRVFAQDTNERNWADKRLYIMQQADRAAALAQAGQPVAVNVAGGFSPDIENALQALWDAAYEQGREQRDHDDEDGTAQQAEDNLRRAIAAALAHPPAKREAGETAPPESQTHVDGERKFCDFPECGCSSGAAERCSHPPVSNVVGLDEATKQKLREALRFSASRSVMSAEDERRILSALETPPVQHVVVTDQMIRAGLEAAPGVRFEHIARILAAALAVPAPQTRERVSDTPSAALEASHE